LLKNDPKVSRVVGTYASYRKILKGLKKYGNESLVVDLEEGEPSTGGCVVRAKGHKSTKQDHKRDSQALALREFMKGLIGEKEEANAKKK
jgi:hypothetical protein